MGINQNKIKELIEDWDWVVNGSISGDGGIPNILNWHINDVEIKVRDKIHDLGLDENKEVIKLDKKALKLILEIGGIIYKEKSPQAKDKKRWWWHLDEIAQGTYPSDLLPDYLREIYLKHQSHTSV